MLGSSSARSTFDPRLDRTGDHRTHAALTRGRPMVTSPEISMAHRCIDMARRGDQIVRAAPTSASGTRWVARGHRSRTRHRAYRREEKFHAAHGARGIAVHIRTHHGVIGGDLVSWRKGRVRGPGHLGRRSSTRRAEPTIKATICRVERPGSGYRAAPGTIGKAATRAGLGLIEDRDLPIHWRLSW